MRVIKNFTEGNYQVISNGYILAIFDTRMEAEEYVRTHTYIGKENTITFHKDYIHMPKDEVCLKEVKRFFKIRYRKYRGWNNTRDRKNFRYITDGSIPKEYASYMYLKLEEMEQFKYLMRIAQFVDSYQGSYRIENETY